MLSDYFTTNFCKESELKTVELLAELVKSVKNYEILKNPKITNKIKSLLAGNPITSVPMFNLFFFFTYFTIENFSGKNENLVNFNQIGAEEKNFIDVIKNKNLSQLDSFNKSYFESAYGHSASDKIFNNAKLWIVYLSISGLENLNNSVVSFEKLENELNLKIEDLEDVLFDGSSSELFKLTIDYETSLVKISYIKKASYNKEYVESLKCKVSSLREKISGFTKKIDSLIINQ